MKRQDYGGGITMRGIQAIADEWLPDKATMQKAMGAARKKTIRWAVAVAVREIRMQKPIPAAVLRARITGYFAEGRIFFGLRPIPLFLLDPKQTRRGVKAKGGVDIPGAFIVDSLEWENTVFRRNGRFKEVQGKTKKLWREMLDYERLHFEDEAHRVIKADIMPYIAAKYYKFLEHELSWRTR